MGSALGLLFAFLVAAAETLNGQHRCLQIMLPGFAVGAIVGLLTQRWDGRGPARLAEAAGRRFEV